MELLILNTNEVLDIFESLIWTDRYCGYGDFEIYTKASDDLLSLLRSDYFIWMKESEHLMIVDGRQIEFDAENGNYIIITGRSSESILERRIVWNQTVLSGSLQNGIQKLLNENAIAPVMPDRTIPNLVFEASDDPAITALTVEAQFTRTNLYETIKNLCSANNLGFKITLSEANQLVFKLYSGADRSYDQIVNSFVVFSPNFENLISSNYSESQKTLKTVTVVAGEGEGPTRKTTIVGGGTGLSRRELYTDARDLSQTVDDVLLPEADYIAQLSQRGVEKLSEHTFEKSFDGEVDTTRMFKYGEDFFLGDVVQIASEYGIKSKARVTEIIHSQSINGIEVYPTFAMLE